MSRLQAWITRLDDRLNPVVVKELRQAVQARSVSSLLLILLVLLVIILGLFLININPYNPIDSSFGEAAFLTILGFVQVATMVLVPGFVAARISSERRGNDLQLMFTTALSPAAVITGKLLSGLTVALLLYSVATPFMTFTYLLRGIDLPTILMLVGFSFLAVAPAVQYAILLACLPIKRMARVLLLVASALAGIYLVPVSMILLPMELLTGSFGRRVFAGSTGLLAATIIIGELMALAMLYAWSWAAVAPRASNRALPVRLSMTALWLVSGVLGLCWAAVDSGERLLPWFYGSVIVLACHMIAAVSQRDRLSMRVLRSIPRRRWLRWPAFLLFSGSAGGVAWSVVLILLTLAALAASRAGGLWPGSSDVGTHLRIGLAIGIYGAGYALLGLLLHRRLLAGRLKPGLTWAVSLLLVSGLAILSVVIDIMAYAGVHADIGSALWRACLPFSLGDEVAQSTVVTIGGPIVILLMGVARGWFWRQVKGFRPPLYDGDEAHAEP